MLAYRYTVENSKLYVILPISFSSTNYCIALTDFLDEEGNSACSSFGAQPISNNKSAGCNLAIDKSTGVPKAIDDQNYRGYMFAVGF